VFITSLGSFDLVYNVKEKQVVSRFRGKGNIAMAACEALKSAQPKKDGGPRGFSS
jgi:hypothetical protein